MTAVYNQRKAKYRLQLVVLLCFVICGAAYGQTPTALLPPSQVKREEVKNGNFLAQYLELLRLEKAYRADEDFADRYLQRRGLVASFFGDVREADQMFDETFGLLNRKTPAALENSPLAALKPQDAETYLLKAAETRRVIMINDGHHQPQTRVLVTCLLRGFYQRGFRYLALETLAENADSELLAKRKYLLLGDGTMTAEPAFGDLARQALEIGFTLVPYEFGGETRQGEKVIDRLNRRETEQAQNIKKRVFDRDPRAKLLVYAGQSHISEKAIQMSGEKEPWILMAMRLKEFTGIDPLTVDQQTMLAHSRPEAEPAVYRDAVTRGWVKTRAVVFTDAKNAAWTLPTVGVNVDVQVFLPPVSFIDERPDWLARDLHRIAYKIPAELTTGDRLRLVQAFFAGEPDSAVPIDQLLLRPSQKIPPLMLPRRRGKGFRLRVIDEAGNIQTFKCLLKKS